MKKLSKIIGIVFIFLLFSSFIFHFVYAEDGVVSVDPQTDSSSDGTYKLLAPIGKLVEAPKNIGDYFNIIFLIAIGFCGALAVIMIVIGGVQYMGDESIFGKTEAKSKITSAIFGLLIALGSYALLNTVNPDLLGGKGVSIKQVSAEIEDESIPWSTYEEGDNTEACPGGFKNVLVKDAKPDKINVCGVIANDLANLINAAKKAGYTLSGYGARSKATTQALRVKNNCPNPETPSTQCKPNAVAKPGSSNHEKGLAVDFNCNGSPMGKIDTNNVCYKWLVENASKFDFYNDFETIKETWHWSTTGT